MKKSKLMKILSEIEGDPDILLWNGMVGDWQDIDKTVIKSELTKMSFAHYKRCIENERIQWGGEKSDYIIQEKELLELKKRYNKCVEWEYSFATEDDIKAKRYSNKFVYLIGAKTRGVKTWDRLGNIEY